MRTATSFPGSVMQGIGYSVLNKTRRFGNISEPLFSSCQDRNLLSASSPTVTLVSATALLASPSTIIYYYNDYIYYKQCRKSE